MSRTSKPSSSRNRKNKGESDVTNKRFAVFDFSDEDDRVEQAARSFAKFSASESSAVTASKHKFLQSHVCGETAKKRNEIFQKNSIVSQVEKSQTSKEKNGIDNELMECFKILNAMENLDGNTYTKGLKLMHEDVAWRKLFLLMSDARKQDFIHSI